MGADFNEWLQGCGFQFFHNIDRYGQFGHAHVFVASMNDMTDEITGLTGSDEDSFHSVDMLLKQEKNGCCFISYDNDPVEALRKCVDKIQEEKRNLDEDTLCEDSEE